MSEIQIPFPLKGVPLKPELKGLQKVDELILQTIAAQCGWDGEARRLLTCSVSGALHTTSPRATAVINDASSQPNQVRTYTNQPTSEIIVLANDGNGNKLWVNINAIPAIDAGYPLDAGDWVKLAINNMTSLQIFVVDQGDKIIILRTV